MILSDLIKRLSDMDLLYRGAIIHIDINGKKYKITSVNGFTEEKRPNECKDPDYIIIMAKEVK